MSNLATYAETPDEQKVSFVITPEPGNMFGLRQVGEMLMHVNTILSDPSGGAIPPEHETTCFLAGIDMTSEGQISFQILMTLRASKPTPTPERT